VIKPPGRRSREDTAVRSWSEGVASDPVLICSTTADWRHDLSVANRGHLRSPGLLSRRAPGLEMASGRWLSDQTRVSGESAGTLATNSLRTQQTPCQRKVACFHGRACLCAYSKGKLVIFEALAAPRRASQYAADCMWTRCWRASVH